MPNCGNCVALLQAKVAVNVVNTILPKLTLSPAPDFLATLPSNQWWVQATTGSS
jgi:hypothetical protein